jgi:hypothetical protein
MQIFAQKHGGGGCPLGQATGQAMRGGVGFVAGAGGGVGVRA